MIITHDPIYNRVICVIL